MVVADLLRQKYPPIISSQNTSGHYLRGTLPRFDQTPGSVGAGTRSPAVGRGQIRAEYDCNGVHGNGIRQT